MNTVFLGPPGAGKGTQAERIAKKFSLIHISTGDLLRRAVDAGTDLGRKANEHMSKGSLVPDQIMVGLIREVLPKNGGFLLDGFPRTVDQAHALDEMLRTEHRALDHVVYFELPDTVATERLLGRKRSDDTPATIEKRLRVYHEQTRPLVEHYKKVGKLRRVDGAPEMDSVTSSIARELERGK